MIVGSFLFLTYFTFWSQIFSSVVIWRYFCLSTTLLQEWVFQKPSHAPVNLYSVWPAYFSYICLSSILQWDLCGLPVSLRSLFSPSLPFSLLSCLQLLYPVNVYLLVYFHTHTLSLRPYYIFRFISGSLFQINRRSSISCSSFLINCFTFFKSFVQL